MLGPLLNSTDSTLNFGSSSFHMSATPPWCPLTAFELMIEYPEAVLGCLSSMSFISVSTANPTLICAKPAAACVIRPPLPSTIFHVAIRKVPLPSGLEGVKLLSMANITRARCQRPKCQEKAKNKFSGSRAVTICTSRPAQPHRPVSEWGGSTPVGCLVIIIDSGASGPPWWWVCSVPC